MTSLKERFLKILKEQENSKEDESIIAKGGIDSTKETFAAQVGAVSTTNDEFSQIGIKDFIPKTKEEYLNELDPETGRRYVIPFLSPLMPNYDNEYVEFMQIKHVDPKQFSKIMNWE